MSKETLLNEAKKFYDIRNYKSAYDGFKKLTKDFSEANYYMGLLFYHGYYPKQDYKAAFTYFKRAWVDLFPDAIYMLGKCYEEGNGIDKDLTQAFKLYEAAQKSGSEDASIKVAKFYEQGLVVERSLTKAIETYVALTKKHNAYAMYKIGYFYLNGIGLKKSIDSAYSWLNKALSAGSVEAMNYFRYLGSKSKSDMRSTSDILFTGKSLYDKGEYEEAASYLEIAAKEESLEAILLISDMYKNGNGVEKSLEKAFNILLKYKDLKDPGLYLAIGKKYELGEGVDSSFVKACKFYELAAKMDNEEAKRELLEMRGY